MVMNEEKVLKFLTKNNAGFISTLDLQKSGRIHMWNLFMNRSIVFRYVIIILHINYT